jgi:hypothetical protein
MGGHATRLQRPCSKAVRLPNLPNLDYYIRGLDPLSMQPFNFGLGPALFFYVELIHFRVRPHPFHHGDFSFWGSKGVKPVSCETLVCTTTLVFTSTGAHPADC